MKESKYLNYYNDCLYDDYDFIRNFKENRVDLKIL